MGNLYFRLSIQVVALVFISSLVLNGCGGGGSASEPSTGQSTTATLSRYSASPGEYLTIQHQSIQAGDAVTVSFRAANGYQLNIVTRETEASRANFSVPVFIDTSATSLHDGAFSSGEVVVSFNGTDFEQPLLIEPALSLDGLQPLFIYQQHLTAARDEYELVKVALNTMAADGYDVSAENAAITARIAELEDLLTQVGLLQSGSIGSLQIGGVELTAADLGYLERMLAASFVGMSDYLALTAPRDVYTPANTRQRITESDCYDAVGGKTDSIAYQNCVQVVRGIEHVISETRRGVKGAGALLASVTVGVAVWGQASAGWAAGEIASSAGLALAYIKSSLDVGLSSLSNKISDAFNENDRARIDEGKNLVKNAIDVGIEMFSALPGKVSEFIGWVSTASTFVDGVNDLEEVKCTAPAQKVAAMDYAFSEVEFCDDFNPVNNTQVSFMMVDVVFNEPAYAAASFSLIGTEVLFIGDITYNDENRSGYPSIYAPTDAGGHFLLMMNKDTITGPGSYAVTTDDIVWDENGNANLFIDTPQIRDEDSDYPVGFSQYAGTLTLEAYGANEGDRIKGSFEIDFEGLKTICLLPACEAQGEYFDDQITGRASGLFDGLLQLDTPQP